MKGFSMNTALIITIVVAAIWLVALVVSWIWLNRVYAAEGRRRLQAHRRLQRHVFGRSF